MTSFPSDVGVAVVSHNNREPLAATLASLEVAGCPRTSILVIDVASTDGTAVWLGAAWPGVRTIRLDRNAGPNPGRNAGIRETPQRFVFLMDGDVVVQPGTIQRLRAAVDPGSRIAIASPIVVHADTPGIIQYAGGRLHFICEAINPWRDRPLAERGTRPEDVDIASGNGLLLDREAALAIGGFDERYFLGKDDGDFTHRVRMAGYRILEVPDALVLHRSRPRGTWLFSYQIRNRWHFMLKNYQWRTLAAILPCLCVHETLQAVVLHVNGHGRAYWKAVGGLAALLPALPRDRAAIARLRTVSDAGLLACDRLIVRDDLAGGARLRYLKRAYDDFLCAYWRLVTKIALRP